jgi:4-fold beta flower protein
MRPQKMHRTLAALAFAALFPSIPTFASDDVGLFDGNGKATAYIAAELTIYLWSGEPVAYLHPDSSGGYHVYGFNGKHLGWFLRGVIWDHQGNASCALKERLRATEFEPFKAFKQFKPFKAFREFAPFRPFLSNSFGDTPCRFFLGAGAS